LNRALAEAAEARVDDVLPVQWQLGELVGMPEDRPALQQLQERRRAGGRPPGARNKRLDEVARLVRERFGDVLLQQVAVATMPLADLLALGLKPAEALAEKRLSAATVLPYIEQKRPIAVDVTGRSVVHLTLDVGGAEVLAFQGVADAAGAELDGLVLDGERNPLMLQAVPAGAQLIADQAGATSHGQARGAAGARATPGGAVFAAVAVSHAPATVVSPDGEVFEPTRNKGPATPGVGEGP
jgi:hypothetical protein